jgi:hypothetical protein
VIDDLIGRMDPASAKQAKNFKSKLNDDGLDEFHDFLLDEELRAQMGG